MPQSGKKNRIPRNVLALARKASTQVAAGSAARSGAKPAVAPCAAESPARKKIVAALKKLHPMD